MSDVFPNVKGEPKGKNTFHHITRGWDDVLNGSIRSLLQKTNESATVSVFAGTHNPASRPTQYLQTPIVDIDLSNLPDAQKDMTLGAFLDQIEVSLGQQLTKDPKNSNTIKVDTTVSWPGGSK